MGAGGDIDTKSLGTEERWVDDGDRYLLVFRHVLVLYKAIKYQLDGHTIRNNLFSGF